MDMGETRQSLETRININSKYLVDVRPPHYVTVPHNGITAGKIHLQPWNGEIKDGKAVGFKPNGLYGLQSNAHVVKKVEDKEEVKVEDIDEKILEKDEHSTKLDFAKNKDKVINRKVNKKKSVEELQKELSEGFSK